MLIDFSYHCKHVNAMINTYIGNLLRDFAAIPMLVNHFPSEIVEKQLITARSLIFLTCNKKYIIKVGKKCKYGGHSDSR